MDQPSSVSDRDVLAAAVRTCTVRIDDVEATNRTLRLMLAGGSLALVALAGCFGWSLWNTLQRQLTPEKLESAMTTKLQAIGPPLAQKLADEVMGAVPEYSELAIERGEKAWPEFATRIANEADTFAAGTEKLVRERADKAAERVAARLASDLKRDFPKLTDERCEYLAQRLQKGLLSEGAGLGEEVQAMIGRERTRLEALLDKLPIEDVALESEPRLQKRFMRSVLQMVDAAVADWPVEGEPVSPEAAVPRRNFVADPAPAESPPSPEGTVDDAALATPQSVDGPATPAASDSPPVGADSGSNGTPAEEPKPLVSPQAPAPQEP